MTHLAICVFLGLFVFYCVWWNDCAVVGAGGRGLVRDAHDMETVR